VLNKNAAGPDFGMRADLEVNIERARIFPSAFELQGALTLGRC